MSEYLSTVIWERGHQNFTDNKYSRGHIWKFDGGAQVNASSSPQVVPAPYSVEENVDPEEAFIAALSSCHMLFFLALAGKKKYLVDKYTDNAVGIMEKNDDGKISMTKVTLKPAVEFSGDQLPTKQQLEELHHKAHELCYIANSVKTKVTIEIPG